MPDYTEGIKKDVAEIKFLIHDLRVEKFINEVIHFHVTLNTDLELNGVEQAQILHGHDLQVLKEKAVSLRRAYLDYSNAVSNYSPDKTVLLTGRAYVETIRSACELILSPLWGRVDKVLTFLPPDSRSAKARTHYLNCLHWIRGVHERIEQFLDEQSDRGRVQEFDIAGEIEGFTRDVAYGYVMERSGGRVQVELDRLDPAVVVGNLPRFRRMYFNLVMNAVDAMRNRDAGVLTVGDTVEGERVVLQVRDNGTGMPAEKIKQLLTDRQTLDGELDSLGFVFVRQTVREFGGELSIESEVGKGTTITIRFSHLPERQASATRTSAHGVGYTAPKIVGSHRIGPMTLEGRAAAAPVERERDAEPAPARSHATGAAPSVNVPETATRERDFGLLLLADYEKSDAEYPGAIFAMAVTPEGKTDYFLHSPYEKYWNITHQDLSPMLANATIRGRLEPNEEKRLSLTLKAPMSVDEYFEFQNVPAAEQNPERFVQMVRDEYIRIGRKLVDTGLPPETEVLLDRIGTFFAGESALLEAEPFSLGVLAGTSQLREITG